VKEQIFLNADIHFLTDYLNLEKIRRDNFEFSISTKGDIANQLIPPLLFIPFVENAVKYSLDSENKSYIYLSFEVERSILYFVCINSKPDKKIKPQKSGGLGLANVKRRLELIYNEKYTLDIKEDENNDLLLTPKLDDLSTEYSNLYEKNIENSTKSLLITNVDKETNSVYRYLLNEQDIEVVKTINKTKKISKNDVSKFISNPTSFFEYSNEEIEERIKEVFDFGYRIVGIGEPYIGYFGSIKIDSPLSEVLKKDPDFINIIDKVIHVHSLKIAIIADRIYIVFDLWI
jgi:hypothetical protein